MHVPPGRPDRIGVRVLGVMRVGPPHHGGLAIGSMPYVSVGTRSAPVLAARSALLIGVAWVVVITVAHGMAGSSTSPLRADLAILLVCLLIFWFGGLYFVPTVLAFMASDAIAARRGGDRDQKGVRATRGLLSP